jgi:predicted amidophosphoribosyltransferase
MSHSPSGGSPRPVGFPGCRLCPYRDQRRPSVCLGCLRSSAGQDGEHVGPAGRCPSCDQSRVAGCRCPTSWCRRRDRGWSVVFSLGAYRGGLRSALLRYKYGRERWWAQVFGCLCAAYLDAHAGWLEEFDLVAAVPSFTGPAARRSWDPVGGILAELAGVVPPGWRVEADLVVKQAETPQLSRSGRAARVAQAGAALRAALSVPDPEQVAGRRILVLDDVLTEGSTLREVATVLRRAGATEVAGLVVARTPWVGADRGPGSPARTGGRDPRTSGGAAAARAGSAPAGSWPSPSRSGGGRSGEA